MLLYIRRTAASPTVSGIGHETNSFQGMEFSWPPGNRWRGAKLGLLRIGGSSNGAWETETSVAKNELIEI